VAIAGAAFEGAEGVLGEFGTAGVRAAASLHPIFSATRNLAFVNGTVAVAIVVAAHVMAMSPGDVISCCRRRAGHVDAAGRPRRDQRSAA
jgi:hypothetical protein